VPAKRRRHLPWFLALGLVATGLAVVPALSASATGERVDIWLTTTSDSGGRTVTRGLQQQTPIAFAPSSGGANQTVTVNENTTYQPFEGGGASFTDTAAYLLRGSSAVSASTRDTVMRKLYPGQRHRPRLHPQPDGLLGPGPLQLLVRRHLLQP